MVIRQGERDEKRPGEDAEQRSHRDEGEGIHPLPHQRAADGAQPEMPPVRPDLETGQHERIGKFPAPVARQRSQNDAAARKAAQNGGVSGIAGIGLPGGFTRQLLHQPEDRRRERQRRKPRPR